MSRTFVFWNHKGGIGKTTLAVHLAFRAIKHRISCLFIDLDTQKNGTDWLFPAEADDISLETFRDNERKLAGIWSPDNFPNGELPKTKITIIDCPPGLLIVDQLSKTHIDTLVIPVAGKFSIKGALSVKDEIKDLGIHCKYAILPIMTSVRWNAGQEEKEAIDGIKDVTVLLDLPTTSIFRKAELDSTPVWDIPFARRSKAVSHLISNCDFLLKGLY